MTKPTRIFAHKFRGHSLYGFKPHKEAAKKGPKYQTVVYDGLMSNRQLDELLASLPDTVRFIALIRGDEQWDMQGWNKEKFMEAIQSES